MNTLEELRNKQKTKKKLLALLNNTQSALDHSKMTRDALEKELRGQLAERESNATRGSSQNSWKHPEKSCQRKQSASESSSLGPKSAARRRSVSRLRAGRGEHCSGRQKSETWITRSSQKNTSRGARRRRGKRKSCSSRGRAAICRYAALAQLLDSNSLFQTTSDLWK